jgi:hypothetical protein
MLKVTFAEPLVVKEADLITLLHMVAQVPATLESIVPAVPKAGAKGYVGAKRGRKPKTAIPPAEPVGATDGDVPAPTVPEATEAPKRRGRPAGSKNKPAEEVPDAKASASDAAKQAATNSISLLKRFSELVEKDYDRALQALEAHGCGKFSELAEEHYDEFGKTLAEAGV